MTGNEPHDNEFLEEFLKPRRFSSKFWLRTVLLLVFVALVVFFKFGIYDKAFSRNELQRSIEIFSISSQWAVKPQNDDPDFKGVTLVPEISFRLRNVGRRQLRHVFLLGVFRFMTTGKFIGEGYRMVLNRPLPPGAESEPIVLRCDFGYRASSVRAFEENRQNWMNAYVDLFAKSQSSPTAPLKTFYISRRIAGQNIEVVVK